MLPSLQPNKTSGQVLWDSDWGSRGMRNSAGKRLQPSDSAQLWGVLEVVLPYGLESAADLIYVLSSQLSKSRLCYVSLLFFLMVTGSRLSHRPPPLPWNSSSVRVVKNTIERATCSYEANSFKNYITLLGWWSQKDPHRDQYSPSAKCLLSSSWMRPWNPLIPVSFPDKDTLIHNNNCLFLWSAVSIEPYRHCHMVYFTFQCSMWHHQDYASVFFPSHKKRNAEFR